MEPWWEIDLERIEQRLWEHPGARERLVRDYGLQSHHATPRDLRADLLQSFAQHPSPDPLAERHDDQTVFRAAVRSLGSNMRRWSAFVRAEPALAVAFADYNPTAASERIDGGLVDVDQVAAHLPGQTRRRDVEAMVRWARKLSAAANYYRFLVDVGQAFERLSLSQLGEGLRRGEMLLCVAGLLGAPPRTWRGISFFTNPTASTRLFRDSKLDGMRFALGSEFLRNLGWSGFKVDRHVERLFASWFPHLEERFQERAAQLRSLIGGRSTELQRYLEFSLAGLEASPDGTPFSHVDNLVWALGSYVEKQGAESTIQYVRRRR